MEKTLRRQSYKTSAAKVGGAARGGRFRAMAYALAALSAIGCATEEGRDATPTFPGGAGLSVYHANAPSRAERYCAWYGTQGADGVLYFGEAAFWSAKASSAGDPTADLKYPGPQLVGRFDLAGERWLPPLEVGDPDSRSGVWDVLASGEQVYFTTFFEEAGSVSPETGRVQRLALGGALNELAPGPDGTVLATRYSTGMADGGNGDVIAFDREGRTARHWSLTAPPGYRAAPKTPLWDGLRRELWVTTDQLPVTAVAGSATQPLHQAIAIGEDNQARLLPELPELMFVAKGEDGTIYRAESDAHGLWLSMVPPPERGKPRRIPLDDAFAAALDFAQDIQVAADGRVAVTRWSGIVHVLHPDGRVRSVALPRLDPAGLYYTAVLHGNRLCATYCADVTVVCVDAP
jgi:hypothetical protein